MSYYNSSTTTTMQQHNKLRDHHMIFTPLSQNVALFLRFLDPTLERDVHVGPTYLNECRQRKYGNTRHQLFAELFGAELFLIFTSIGLHFALQELSLS